MGLGTGEGGDRIVVDDPHNVLEAESDTKRREVLQWWDETMSTRLNDPETGAHIIIMQRVHEQDLTGHILAKNAGYEHLMLPMRYETNHPAPCSTVLGEVDIRDEPNEPLWDERFSEEVLGKLEKDLGEYAWAGQMQQRPAPREGGIIKVDNIQIVDVSPCDTVASVRAWDKAATQNSGARTAGVRIDRLEDGRYLLVHCEKGQWSQDEREKRIQSIAVLDGVDTNIWMEQEPGSAGKDSVQLSIRGLAGFSARAERATGDKLTRADPFAVQVEAGNVLMLRGAWNQEYVDELRMFPNGKFKDQMDATSLAFNKVALSLGWGDFYGTNDQLEEALA